MKQTELKKIHEEHAKWLRGEGGNRAVYYEENFTGLDFTEMNFTKADFSGSDFTGANFNNSIWDSSVLKKAVLSNCTSDKTEFNNTKLQKAIFADSTFGNTSFIGAELNRAKFTRAVLFNATSFAENLADYVCFTDAILQDVIIASTTFYKGIFRNTKFAHVNTYYYASYENCDFSGAAIQNTEFYLTSFYDCKFHEALFKGVDLRNSNFENLHTLTKEQLIGISVGLREGSTGNISSFRDEAQRMRIKKARCTRAS